MALKILYIQIFRDILLFHKSHDTVQILKFAKIVIIHYTLKTTVIVKHDFHKYIFLYTRT